MNYSSFVLATTIKHHLRNYIKKYNETKDFLNKHIYIDNTIENLSSAKQILCTMLEVIEIFKSTSIQLRKMHTNSKFLLESWKKIKIISNDYAKSFQIENMPYKVFGIAWNSLNDCFTICILTFEN